MTTFEDVEEKYKYVGEHMDFCRAAALSDEFPAYATWLHPPTLARWLYGSIVEFDSEFRQVVYKLTEKTPEQQMEINHRLINLTSRCIKSQIDIKCKFREENIERGALA